MATAFPLPGVLMHALSVPTFDTTVTLEQPPPVAAWAGVGVATIEKLMTAAPVIAGMILCVGGTPF